VLLIHPGHKLVQLLQAIDWGEIDRRCEAFYLHFNKLIRT
jgi:hypothetical protein